MTETTTVNRKFPYLNKKGKVAFVELPVQKYIPVTQAVVFVEGHDTAVILKDESQIVQAFKKGYINGVADEYTRARNFNDNLKVDFSPVVEWTSDCPSIDCGVFQKKLCDEAELQIVDNKLVYTLNNEGR